MIRNVVLMVIISLTISIGFTGLASTILKASGRVSISDIVADRHTASPGGKVRLQVKAADSAGCPLSYTWKADGGNIAGPADSTTVWTSPVEEGQFRIRVSVANAVGSKAEAFTDIIVSKYSQTGPQ